MFVDIQTVIGHLDAPTIRQLKVGSIESTLDCRQSEKLPGLMEELYADQLVVVANPTRGGLHASVIDTIRQVEHISKLVYVSCAPEDYAMRNFVHLCIPPTRNNQLKSPFVPVNATPVDLFPHTHHCELVLAFERFAWQ